MPKVRLWEASAEHPQMICTAGDKLADCFYALAEYCETNKLDYAHAVAVSYWEDDGRWTVNLFY